jgi:iron complex outermembrane receptor protein
MIHFKKALRFCFLVSLLVIAGPFIVLANISKLNRHGAIKTSLHRTLPFNANMQQQGLITGQVLDRSGHPLAYSAVSLTRVTDAVIVKRASCDSVGKYRFTGIPSGSYRLTASQIGYLKQSSQPFTLASDSAVNVLAIVLSASANQLKEVQIRAKKPLFERQIDRTIVNVESSALTAGGSVIDLLEIAPGVAVDQNQITLKGKQGVTVMIDDKVVKLSASQVSSLLQSMPASSIDKIELISNPSAKYDAQGKGGIINIKTKKGTSLGFNGTVTTTLGIGNYPKFSEGLTLNYKLKKLNLFSNYSYQHNKSLNQYLSDKIISGEAPVNYHQDKTTHGLSDAHNARLGADYDLNSRNTFGVIGTLNTSTPELQLFRKYPIL